MSDVSQGLELKELREALERIIKVWDACENYGEEPERKVVKLKWDEIEALNAAFENAVSREKSSYEIEAELMDAVIGEARDIFFHRIGMQPLTYESHWERVAEAVKALDIFRGKK